jgi:hypothetical protein
MSTTRTLFTILALAVGAILIAACGGGDDDAKTSATATQQQQQSSSTTTAKPTEAGGETTETPGGTETAPPSEPVTGDVGHACDLLTIDDVASALGESVSEPDRGQTIDTLIGSGVTAAVSTCGWTTQSFASSISMTYYAAPGGDNAISDMIGLACTNKQSVDVGADSACWYDAQGVQIQAAKGGSFIDMFATTTGDASNILHELMSKAIDRVP